MKFNPVELTTKSGRSVLLREAAPDDAKQLADVIKKYVKTGFIPLTEEELRTLEELKTWIR